MSGISINDLSQPTPAPSNKRLWLKIGIATTVVLVILFAFCSRPPTVEQYREKIMNEVDKELAEPNSSLRQYIEDAHLTVTVQSAKVVRCDVSTVDGSDSAGKNDSNIDKVDMLIRFTWQGWLTDGFTDFRLVYDARNDRPEKAEIEYTTALFDTSDPEFWENLGIITAVLLL